MASDAAEELAHAQKHRGKIDGQRAVPLLERHVLQGHVFDRPETGVGDEDLDRAEASLDLGEQPFDLGLQRQIGAEGDAGGAQSRGPVRGPDRRAR